MYAFPSQSLCPAAESDHRPGYIAGVTNPIFESAGEWDLLCDISSSRMVVSKDIMMHHPPTAVVPPTHPLNRTATLKTEGSMGSEEDMIRPSKDLPQAERKGENKSDNDNLFMEDVRIVALPWSRHDN